MPRHKKKKRAAAKPAPSVKKRDWLVGDLVVAKLRGHRPWPAQIQKPEDYGYDARPHRIFVTFFGTEETCFCSYNKITPFTSAVRKSLAEQLQKINTNPELERAIKEIFAADDELRLSSKSHGSNQKEDEEMASEKSEEEEPPVERSRKRARVVEETVAPAVSAVDKRPAKQEKTVKSMAAEQVQKLPRKVRIKVSTQGSDLPTPQLAALSGSDKAGVGSSQASQSGSAPLKTSEPIESVKPPVKNGGRKAAGKVVDSINLKEPENVVLQEEETVSRHAKENGSDAADKTQGDHAKTGSASPKTQKTEVGDDDKPDASKTIELAVAKEDDGKLGVKTSETAIGKEDDSAALKQPVTLETVDEGVDKMEVDDEKSSASKTHSEPAIGKGDESDIVKESVSEDIVEKMEVDDEKSSALKTSSEPAIGKGDESDIVEESVAEDVVEKMEVDEKKAKTTDEPATEKEDHSAVSLPDTVVEASDVGTKESKGNDSPAVAEGHDPQTVEDMETSQSGQEQVAPVAKESLVNLSKSQDSQRGSGTKVDREDAAVEIQASASAEPDPDAIDEAKASVGKNPVLASKDEDLGEQKHETQETQVAISVPKDGVASRIDSHDGAVTGESLRESTDQGEKVPDSEAQASRLKQDGAVEQAEHQDEAPKKAEDQEGAVKEVEEQDIAVKISEDQVTSAKKPEHQSAEVEKTEVQGTVVKKTEDQGTEAKKTDDKDVEKKTENVEVKKIEDHGAEVQATDDKDAALKTILGKGSPVKKAQDTTQISSGEIEVPTPESAKGDAVPKTVTEKTVDPIPVQQESDTPQIGTGNGEVLSAGKEEGQTPQLDAADVVELSTPAKQDAPDEKPTDSSTEQPTTTS